jgi:trans-2,3-dihydro-3-hydroxyanthranilate isomerase
MPHRYQILDVFTDEKLAGNPLAVVHDAADLDGEAMQRIAREFNLSETVFVLPPDNPVHSAKIRIFTQSRELPFAGHPTIGTAVALAASRFAGTGQTDAVIVLEENVGPIRCGVTLGGEVSHAAFDSPRLPEEVGEAQLPEVIAAATGLAPAEMMFENHRPSRWSAGVPYHFVPVRDRAALEKIGASQAAWNDAFGADGVYFYSRDPVGHEHHFRARMFVSSFVVTEDPATGSAAAAFAGAVHCFDGLSDGQYVSVIEQGFEMGRPSLIRLEIEVSQGAIGNVRIGGHAVHIAEGTLAL